MRLVWPHLVMPVLCRDDFWGSSDPYRPEGREIAASTLLLCILFCAKPGIATTDFAPLLDATINKAKCAAEEKKAQIAAKMQRDQAV